MQRTSLPLEFWFFCFVMECRSSLSLSLSNRLDLFGNNFVIGFSVYAERQSLKIPKHRLLANNKHHWARLNKHIAWNPNERIFLIWETKKVLHHFCVAVIVSHRSNSRCAICYITCLYYYFYAFSSQIQRSEFIVCFLFSMRMTFSKVRLCAAFSISHFPSLSNYRK